MESFFNHCPPTLDKAIPDKHNFLFIKEDDKTNGFMYLGGIMSNTTFGA